MKRIAILGAAESGIGSAILAQKQGWDVFVSDMGSIKDKYKEQLETHHIRWEEGGHTEALILNADQVVKSPGIPDTAPIVQKLIKQGTPILSELEFAKPYSRSKVIAITGSNGKTTTTTLIYYIMQQWGVDVGLAGNIGRSFALQVAEGDHDWYVLEISSFQLDNMYTFHPDVAVLMNITPDHLDRYEFEMQHYVDSKMRIMQNMTEDDLFIYWKGDSCVDCETEKRMAGFIAPPTTPSSQPAVSGRPRVCAFEDGDFEKLGLKFSLMGQHNKRNALAAYLATKQAGAPEDVVRASLQTFPGVEHRLERVAEKGDILFVNDSKATNVDACYVALQAMERPTILIVGGRDKGNDYSTLFDIIREKCVGLVYLGADNQKLHDSFDQLGLPISDTHCMKDCVDACIRMAHPGDTVLLSPCCASFDLFKNMEDRGEQFKALVHAYNI